MSKKFMEFINDNSIVFHTNNHDIAKKEFFENIGGAEGLEFEDEIIKLDKRTQCNSFREAIDYLRKMIKLIRKHAKKYCFTDEDRKESTNEELEKTREEMIDWYNTLLRILDEAESEKDHNWSDNKNETWFIRFVNS